MLKRFLSIQFTIMVLILTATFVWAQMAGPFLKEPDSSSPGTFKDVSVQVKCMKGEALKSLLDERKMHILILASSKEGIMKVIFTNEDGDVLVTNVFPDQMACVLDILPMAQFSSEFVFSKKKKEGSNE